MRWEDERYVRLYVRDTAEWLALGWQAQALLVLLLRKADRAGIVHTGKAGVRGLAALVGMPLEVVTPALATLLDDGCLRAMDGGYVFPNFLNAQEAKSSDAQRKREQRARDRDKALASGASGSAAGLDAEAAMERKKPEGFVYIAQDPQSGLVKIGYSSDPATRLRSLVSGRSVKTLALVEGTREMEREFHEMWDTHRTEGEWFNPVTALLEWAAALSRGVTSWRHADAPPVTPSRRSVTPSRAVPCRAVPSRAEPKSPPPPKGPGDSKPAHPQKPPARPVEPLSAGGTLPFEPGAGVHGEPLRDAVDAVHRKHRQGRPYPWLSEDQTAAVRLLDLCSAEGLSAEQAVVEIARRYGHALQRAGDRYAPGKEKATTLKELSARPCWAANATPPTPPKANTGPATPSSFDDFEELR